MTWPNPTARFAPPKVSASLLASILAASLLTGCASSSGPMPGDEYAPGLVIASPGWLNSTFAQPEPGTGAPSAPYGAGNPTLRPNETWLGTIGLSQRFSESYEVGVGLAVPNPFTPNSQSPVAAERARDLGVGIWLKFDF